MIARFLFVVVAIASLLSLGLPGSGGMSALAVIFVGWPILNRIDELIVLMQASPDATAAALRRAAKPKGVDD